MEAACQPINLLLTVNQKKTDGERNRKMQNRLAKSYWVNTIDSIASDQSSFSDKLKLIAIKSGSWLVTELFLPISWPRARPGHWPKNPEALFLEVPNLLDSCSNRGHYIGWQAPIIDQNSRSNRSKQIVKFRISFWVHSDPFKSIQFAFKLKRFCHCSC